MQVAQFTIEAEQVLHSILIDNLNHMIKHDESFDLRKALDIIFSHRQLSDSFPHNNLLKL